MIAGNHDFVQVGQGAEPAIKIFHILQRAGTKAVAGMNQYVAGWYVCYFLVQAVGVLNLAIAFLIK